MFHCSFTRLLLLFKSSTKSYIINSNHYKHKFRVIYKNILKILTKIYKVFLDGKLVGYNPNGGRRSFWGGGNQGPGGQPWWGGNSKDSGSNKDKKGDNYYKVNENNVNEKGEEDNDDSSEEDEEVEYRSIFMLTKNVETFSGVTQV